MQAGLWAGCRQGYRSRAWYPSASPILPGLADYSSTQATAIPAPWLPLLMEPALGEAASTWDTHLQPSSLGTQAVTVPRGGCHQPGGTGSILSSVPATVLSLMTISACLSPQLTLLCRLIRLHTLRNAAAKGCCSLTGVQRRLGDAHLYVCICICIYLYISPQMHFLLSTRMC